MRKYTKNNKIEWFDAPDVYERIEKIVTKSSLDWIDLKCIKCFRSNNSKSRAIARIWGLPKIWQIALNNSPFYIVEVISEKFDKLSEREKDNVIIHELAHIPRNFSGSLVPHFRKGKRKFKDIIKKLTSTYNH